MKKVVVIGAGPGGYVAAIRAAQLGAEVYLVERDRVGGTCLNHGCIPTKSFITSADVYNNIKRGRDFGIEVEGFKIVFNQVVARKNKIVTTLRKGIETLVSKNKIKLINGLAKIKDRDTVLVLKDDGEISLHPDYVIIATGSVPRSLEGMEFDGNYFLSSNELLNLKEIPESIAIIGGGVIGCEFAYILNSFGCKVYIIEAMDRLLPIDGIDRSCSLLLQREMKKKKINIILNSIVHSVTKDEGGILKIKYKNKDTSNEGSVLCEKVAVCVGRSPSEFELISDVEKDERGWIKVDDTFKTSVENIYAIGDCLGPTRPMLAHVASHEAMCCVSNIFGDMREMNYLSVPSVIYTKPEIGCVGLSEDMAKDRGIDFDVSTIMFRSLGRAHAASDITGETKIVFDRKNKKILGIHIIGAYASELISTGCVLLNKGASIDDLEKTVFAHPTFSEIYHEMALKSLSHPLHG